MRRRIWVGVLVLAVLAGLTVALEPSRVVWGLLAHESFYDGRPTSYWRNALEDDDPLRHEAARARLQAGGASAVAVLSEVLRGSRQGRWDDAGVRSQAAEILGAIGPEASAAVPALVAALDDPFLNVRQVAARALGASGAGAKDAVPALAAKLRTDDRVAATEALVKLGPAAAEAVPALQTLLADPDAQVRWKAAEALGEIGPAAAAAAPALIAALKDPDAEVREHAAESLGQIGPAVAKEAVPPLIAALGDSQPMVRRDAVRSLGDLGPAAKEALPAVRKLTQDESALVREAAARAQRRIDPSALPDAAKD